MQRWQRSTAKPIEPQRIPEGFLFVDQQNVWSWTRGTVIFLGYCLGCVILLPFLGVALLGFLENPSLSLSQFLLLGFLSVFTVGGIIGAVQAIYKTFVMTQLRPGEAILSTYPLMMGESCQVRFRRQLRNGKTPHPGKVTAKWHCYEWVQYSSGSSIETTTHTLWETDLPEWPILPMTEQIEYNARLTVRPEGPPSIYGADNQVRWELQITVDLPGIAKGRSHVQFTVVPEVLR
ncbi:hypothetical protein IQ254_24270 [Nodosilinea sp. LEGE 07088]|uniref:hypothetical protein n=1 Tax=Nodosilinea sp. LEGE 07088 TaxID=2777968 RepID=UPI001880F0FB|nr:hypothetical protein [Nodosilinea sp. LEGE 07088]MBE9140277.1 hypothetical protein [Nodosilinea sp. LEGE 07088]